MSPSPKSGGGNWGSLPADKRGRSPKPSRKNARPEEDRLERLNELRARWGKAPLVASKLSLDSCEVEIAREERKLGTALRMRGATAWGLRAA